jgi:hypothetical protein
VTKKVREEWISSLHLEDLALPPKRKIVVLQSRDHRNACELEFAISTAS